jgi:AraC-like DNA-binding protein
MKARPSSPLPLDRIEAYLDACFTRESPPRVSELARALGVTCERLMETFCEHVGVKPGIYLRRRQVALARQLLRRTKIPVDRVGYMVGFGTRRTFFRVFQRLTGVTPAQFRRRINDTRHEQS